jgi:hypothetical protein
VSDVERSLVADQLDDIKAALDTVLHEVRTALNRLNLSDGDRVATVARVACLEEIHADLTANVIGLREKVDRIGVALAEHLADHRQA